MNKIINGKKYDTNTAQLIAEWSNGLPNNDFKYCSEDLYKTSKGQFFIHGDGGAMSKYSSGNGKSQWGSEDIILLGKEEALEWISDKKIPYEKISEHIEVEEG